MNFRAISFYLSLFCFPISFLSFINILYSTYFDYFLSVESYTLTLISSLSVGILFYFFGKNAFKKIVFFEQLILIILVISLSSFFISLPYYFSNYQITFINSLFEGFSGITLTGFTIFDNIKYLDPTLIIWRSTSQWIGGLYFLFFLILIFSNKQFRYKLNDISLTSVETINTEQNIKNIILKVFLIYLSLSILIFTLLAGSEIRLFNSLNLSMTIISTGGFLPTNNLSQIITNKTQEISLIIAFFISCLNIFLLINIFDKKKIIKNHYEDFLLIFTIIIISLIIFALSKNISFTNLLLNILSCFNNSGITTNNTSTNLSLFYLSLTILGGSLISNTSGIKIMRFYILIKATFSEMLKLVKPNTIINQNIFYTDKKIDYENVKLSFLIFISFFISIFILTVMLIPDLLNFENTLKLAILTITNTTNSNLYGVENISFTNLITSSKISLIIFMVIAKIELISVFLLIKNFFSKN